MWFCVFAPVISGDYSDIVIEKEFDIMSSTISITEEDKYLFLAVQARVSKKFLRMMETLWVNWSHLGMDDKTKSERICNLEQIEDDLHRDVIQETEQKLKALTNEVNDLKKEAKELSDQLAIEIDIQDFPDDVMLADYKKSLEEQISGYRQQLEQRKTTVKRLTEWQRDLCEALGVSIREVKEVPLPSEEDLTSMSHHLEQLQQERDKRSAIFLNTQRQIKEIMECLGVKPTMKFEFLVVNSLSVQFKVTDKNMERLAELLHNLREQLHATENRVLELRERLNRMWDILDEDRVYRSNFLQANPGIHPETEKALRDEIARCDAIKKQKMQVLVAKLRTEIKKMWDQCMYSEEQRSEFVHYRMEIFTEDTLTLHEMYLDDLKKIYDDNKHLYELVSKRQELWDKMNILEAQASDPTRYQNRGGQLLKEEKQRKIIVNKLPKIEAQLAEMVEQYRAANNKEFLINGRPLLEVIRDDWTNRKTERTIKMTARKRALTPTTPSFGSLALSPRKRNRTAAGLVHSERAKSAKRPLLGSPAKERECRRTAATTSRKRMSGRIAALAASHGVTSSVIIEKARRKINLDAQPPRIAVNGNILKHKRTSRGTTRRSRPSRTESSFSMEDEEETAPANQVAENTILTSYSDFKEHINENKASRSSTLVQGKPQLRPARSVTHLPTIEQKQKKKPQPRKRSPPSKGKRTNKHHS